MDFEYKLESQAVYNLWLISALNWVLTKLLVSTKVAATVRMPATRQNMPA